MNIYLFIGIILIISWDVDFAFFFFGLNIQLHFEPVMVELQGLCT